MFSMRKTQTDRHEAAGAANFVIVHRFWEPGTDCLPGEEVLGVWFEPDGAELQLPLPLALRLLFDHFGRHRWLAQSAQQIEAAMRCDPFYLRHAAKSRASKKLTRRMSRSAIKVYVARVREALQSVFDEAGVDLKANEVLVSERTVSSEVGYRLRANVRWVHLP